MRLELKLLIVSALVVFPVCAKAQFRPAKCEVQPLWAGETVRSSNFGLMGSFEVDDISSVRSFRLAATNLIASVGINFEEDYSKYKKHRVRLAITVSDQEETKIFESVNSSEARTQYRKGWNLAVTKNVSFDNLIYMFTLRCWDAAGKRPFL